MCKCRWRSSLPFVVCATQRVLWRRLAVPFASHISNLLFCLLGLDLLFDRYEILHKIYNSSNINDVVRKKSTSVAFLSKMISLFHSRDHRERECLKQTTHRIYGACPSFHVYDGPCIGLVLTAAAVVPLLKPGRLTNRRAAIRKIFNHVFAREIYEPMPNYRGISEILDILASIVNGFACPIKQEHRKMLYHYLIPLHKLPDEHMYYHQQLHYCMILFAGKDHTFTVDIIRGMLKYWPVGNNPKEQQFLQELEDLFEYVHIEDFEKIHDVFLRRFVQLIEAPHFQTTERALWFWRNPAFNALVSSLRYAILCWRVAFGQWSILILV